MVHWPIAVETLRRINDELEDTIEKVKNIIDSEEQKIKRYKKIKDTFYGG